jgi:hypothetical protein
MYVFELTPIHSNVKSFYKKAFVIIENDSIKLKSYNTIVGEIKNNRYFQLWDGRSCTTTRHIKEFKKQLLEV